jgi:deoxyribonuclease-4
MATSFRFGTVGSPITTPKKPGGSVGAIQRLSELGLGALELGWVQSVRVSEETCIAIKNTSEQNDVFISVHAPYFINLNALDDEWPKSRKRLMDAAYYGNLAGATDIIFHPGSYFGREPSGVLEIAIPRLKECVEELRSSGNPVVLRPETMGKAAFLGSFEDTVILSQEINGVEPCIDFAHLHARAGNGSMNTFEEWMGILEIYAHKLGAESLQRLHIHMSGIEYTAKGEKRHLALTESDFNLNALLDALKEMNCAGRILSESPVMEEDALLMQKHWAA